MDWDVAVIGAGAAGILAATRAAELGKRTVLLEKNRRPGVKILISGGARCNLTHDCDARGIMEAFSENGRWLRDALRDLGPREVVKLIEDEGVPTQVEDRGKIFPVSGKSQDILGALVRRMNRSGATLECGRPLAGLERSADGFALRTAAGDVTASKVIVTTGGRSYAAVGTTGDAYPWAERLGHRIIPTRPALTPITSAEPWVTALAGLTLTDVEGRIFDPAAKPPIVARRRGPFLFTHFGMSGPVPMDLSRFVSGHAHPETLVLELDLLPDTPAQDLDAWLVGEAALGGKRLVATILADRVARRVADVVIDRARVPADRRAAELSRAERTAVVTHLKRLPLRLSGTLGYDKAEVTAGGVALDEIDPRTCGSRLVPGLFFAGEVLDLDGWIGGYNFQAAFSTGWLAGTKA
ncbi:MAG: NAD(P)/FAD-dependent oxidoreductase [Planctomycetes bacterium]|nr:NAD(P)/FAD-dependent oxidoreductase [Planctomycetota bacterium]